MGADGTDPRLHRVTPDDWESHRDIRLAMLQDAPDAFWFTYADEAAFDEADWRERIEGAWLVQARDADGVLGSAGLGSHWEPERGHDGNARSACTSHRGRAARGVGEAPRPTRCLDEARQRGKAGSCSRSPTPTRRRSALYERWGSSAPAPRTPHPRRPTCARSRWSTRCGSRT